MNTFKTKEKPSLQVLVEGSTGKERIRFAKLLAALAHYKYTCINADNLNLDPGMAYFFMQPLESLSKFAPEPCVVVIIDNFMRLVQYQSEGLSLEMLCHYLEKLEKKGIHFIALRGDKSDINYPKFEDKWTHKVCLENTNFLLKQFSDS